MDNITTVNLNVRINKGYDNLDPTKTLVLHVATSDWKYAQELQNNDILTFALTVKDSKGAVVGETVDHWYDRGTMELMIGGDIDPGAKYTAELKAEFLYIDAVFSSEVEFKPSDDGFTFSLPLTDDAYKYELPDDQDEFYENE